MGRTCTGGKCILRRCSMIETIMYFGIGFFFAALSVLVVVPLVHGRAVRLTTRRLEGAIPSSVAETVAHKELGKKGDAINRLKIELGGPADRLLGACVGTYR